MGWETDKISERECGCKNIIQSHDSFNTSKTFDLLCTFHKEQLDQTNAEQAELTKLKIKKKEDYYKTIRNIETKKHVPIKHAINKFRLNKDYYSDLKIKNKLLSSTLYKELLEIQKEKNRWYVSNERLDMLDFVFIES